MKILIALAGYFPAQKYGGPPVSIQNFCNLVSDSAECFIVTGNHEKGETTPLPGVSSSWERRENANVLYLPEDKINGEHYKKITEEIQPDWIYLNSLFDYKRTAFLLKIAIKHKIKVLLAPRGELCKNAFGKKYKKLPYIWLLRKYLRSPLVHYQSTSEEETEQIKRYLKASEDRIFFLDNIPSIPTAQNKIAEKKAGELKIVFFSRIHPKKNLLFALHCLKKLKGNVCFDVYGPQEDEAYWKECESYIAQFLDNIRVSYKGIIAHEDIQATLNNYHLFFFPTLSENYGHVIAEALFAGIPILISDQTPWTDVNAYDAGAAFALNEQEQFESFLERMVNIGEEEYLRYTKNATNYVLEKTNVQKIKSDYLELFYGK